jgi:hypothetical protein
VDAFITEAMRSTSRDVYQKQFESAQRGAGEKGRDFMTSPAARWEALQEIIAGHPEMQSLAARKNDVQQLRASFLYRYRKAHTRA